MTHKYGAGCIMRNPPTASVAQAKRPAAYAAIPRRGSPEAPAVGVVKEVIDVDALRAAMIRVVGRRDGV